MTDDEMIFIEFETVGEETVLADWQSGRWQERRRYLAPIWLQRQSKARSAAREAIIDASNLETNHIARSAKNAAWAAAIAAMIAIAVSIVALLR